MFVTHSVTVEQIFFVTVHIGSFRATVYTPGTLN